jgi:hypothetical protein
MNGASSQVIGSPVYRPGKQLKPTVPIRISSARPTKELWRRDLLPQGSANAADDGPSVGKGVRVSC